MRAPWWALLSLMLAGCVSVGQANLADDGTMAQIKVGQTTKQQVTGLLGEPESRGVIELGGARREWWAYSYATATVNPIDYLLIYGLFYNGLGLFDTRYDLDVFFDQRDRVTSLSRTRTDYDMGRPFEPGQITTVSEKSVGFSEPGKEPIRFEHRAEFRF
jgi:hypothetical protein